jgi:hypothetical protein
VTLALSAYAAVIISFLGGIHWGLAMRQAGAGRGQPGVGRGALAAGLAGGDDGAGQRPGDPGPGAAGLLLCRPPLYPAQGAAPWLVLRFRLSAVAALSCFIGAAGA